MHIHHSLLVKDCVRRATYQDYFKVKFVRAILVPSSLQILRMMHPLTQVSAMLTPSVSETLSTPHVPLAVHSVDYLIYPTFPLHLYLKYKTDTK